MVVGRVLEPQQRQLWWTNRIDKIGGFAFLPRPRPRPRPHRD